LVHLVGGADEGGGPGDRFDAGVLDGHLVARDGTQWERTKGRGRATAVG
jgi:hypothetical protein